jgi:hypothetical protein
MRKREQGYEKFWGREFDIVAHREDDERPHIDVYRFPPGPRTAPMGGAFVYITGGMSDSDQPDHAIPQEWRRIELSAYARTLLTDDDGHDLVMLACRFMARYPFAHGSAFQVGHTFDYGRPLKPGSPMEGYYLASIPLVDAAAAVKATQTATRILHLVPVTRTEMEFKLRDGAPALLNLFSKHSLEPFFDLDRAPLV